YSLGYGAHPDIPSFPTRRSSDLPLSARPCPGIVLDIVGIPNQYCWYYQPIGGLMHAAVVTDFAAPPQYREHPDPVAEGPHEAVVDVLAAPLHRLARARAAGLHYTTTTALPLVPGVDAVVRDQDGKLWYTIVFGRDVGTFAERTVID